MGDLNEQVVLLSILQEMMLELTDVRLLIVILSTELKPNEVPAETRGARLSS